MKKVLLVDDQPAIRLMLYFSLREHFALEQASDAAAAYAMILDERPDAIVLDVMMPGSMDGYQLCERIKRDPRLMGIHVVLVTACAQVADQELGRSLGADAYFIKPFSPLRLEQHLKAALHGVPAEDGRTA